MPYLSGRSALFVILVAWMTASAVADPGGPQNDAGSGGDAGDARSIATAVAPGLVLAGQLRPNDIDWYAASFNGALPTCIRAEVKATSPIFAAISAETNSGVVSAPIAIAAESTGVGGVAGMLPLTATLRVAGQQDAPNFGSYDFRIDRVNVPGGNTDMNTGADVGDSATNAMPISAGCLGGHLSVIPTVDQRDVYAISVPSGQVVTYSLASNYNGISLALTDVVGNVLGPVLAPGESASFTASGPGTVYLTSARTTAVGDVGYVIGAVVGPEPSGCRPYCMDL